MKQWWKIATFATGLGSAAITAIAVCVMLMVTLMNQPPRSSEPYKEAETPMVPTSGRIQQTPNHVLASVILYNGELQGSGTIISRGHEKAALLTAAHNFSGRIGGKFWVYYADGTYTEATLLAFDRERDLAVACVDADTILTHTYIPESFPQDEVEITSVGFANGKGPLFRDITYKETIEDLSRKCTIWKFNVDDSYWDGDSGGGVFFNNALCAVATHRNYEKPNYVCHNGQWVRTTSSKRAMYATAHDEIRSFLAENSDKLSECGDWDEEPIMPVAYHGPPLWQPTPNVPIHIPQQTTEQYDLMQKPSGINDPEVPLAPNYDEDE